MERPGGQGERTQRIMTDDEAERYDDLEGYRVLIPVARDIATANLATSDPTFKNMQAAAIALLTQEFESYTQSPNAPSSE